MREDIVTEYTADVRGFRKGANYVDRRMLDLQRGVNGRLDRIDARWKRSSRAIDGFRGSVSAIAITAGLIKFGRDAFNVAKDFEAAMNRIKAATDAPAAQMDVLKARAMELGRTTVFSAGQVGDAAELLQKNGLSLAEILGGALDASVQLAAATGGSLSGSADLATDIMEQFGTGASELPNIVDGLTAAMIKSKFGFDDLRLAIGQSGAVAASSGVEFEDLLTTIAATAAAGTGGSDVGTAFKNMVVKFAGVSSEARKEIEMLGLQFYDSEGALRPMVEVVGELERVFAGMSEQARTSSLQIIFGTDAYKLASSLALSGAESFQKLADSMGEVSAADQAAARMLGAEGAAKRLAAAWEGVLLAFGDNGGLSAQTAALNGLASALNFITENFDALGVAVIAVAGSRGIGALVAAMQRNNQAARQAVAVSGAQVKASKMAVASAQAELRLRKANLVALGQSAAGTRKHTAAVKALGLAQKQLAVATRAAATASHLQDAAIKRVALTARLAQGAMGALRGAMAFFGGPIGLAITAVSVGVAVLGDNAAEAAGEMDQAAMSTSGFESAIGDLITVTNSYAGMIAGTATAQNAASGQIIAATEREYNAKKSLLELELQRQKALQAERQMTLSTAINEANIYDVALEESPFGPVGDEVSSEGLAAALDTQKQIRAEMELAALAMEAAGEALALGFSAGGGAGDGSPPVTPPGGGGGGGAGAGDGYAEWLTEINKRIEAQGAEAAALGLTALEADKLTAAREFLTMAERAGLELTPELRAEVGRLAEAYALAAQEARETSAAQAESAAGASAMGSEVAGAVKQMLADLKNGKSALESFLGIWESFITKITDRALDSAVDAIFTGGGGSGSSGGGGFLNGLLGSLLGGLGGGGGATPVPHASGGAFSGGAVPINKVVNSPRLFGMGGGGVGVMGERGPEAVMPLVRGANGDLAVQTAGGGGGGVSVHNSFDVTVHSNDPNTRVEIMPSSRQQQRAARGITGG